jgi:CheY-like chemotaxis protein
MNGDVHVESELGAGSHFWVDLPLAPVAEAPAPVATAAAEPSESSLSVLAVDDDPVNQLVVAEMLKALGCDVDVVADGRQALQAVQRKQYDIVFMDCHMPGMDGYEAARRIRAAEDTSSRRTPIVALTADSLASDRERCLAAGMDDFLTKPVRSSHLSTMIEHWTGQRTLPATQW